MDKNSVAGTDEASGVDATEASFAARHSTARADTEPGSAARSGFEMPAEATLSRRARQVAPHSPMALPPAIDSRVFQREDAIEEYTPRVARQATEQVGFASSLADFRARSKTDTEAVSGPAVLPALPAGRQ